MARRYSLGMFMLVVCALAAGPAAASAPPRVAEQHPVPMPGGVCGVAPDPSTPVLAARGGRLAVFTLLRGGVAAARARSDDGGRTWSASVVDDATSCTGAPDSHEFLVNPRAALGPDGRAWLASSWGGAENGLFAYGVEALPDRGGAVRPSGTGQDITVLPDEHGGSARLLWTAIDQVPNPATYAPAAMRLETATTAADGGLTDRQAVLSPRPGMLLDDSSLVRAGGTLVAVASSAPLEALVGTLNPVTADEPVRFAGVSVRSEDGGRTWQPGGAAGEPVLFAVERDGHELLVGLSDVAAGPGGSVVRVYAGLPEDGLGSVMATLSDDGGRTWSKPRALLRAPVVALQPAAAFLPDGRLALAWYDGRADRAGDGRFDLQPRAALIDLASDRRRGVALGKAFDVGRLIDPGYPVDGSALGVTQDVAAVPRGFAAVHTAPAPAGVTRVVFSRLRAPGVR